MRSRLMYLFTSYSEKIMGVLGWTLIAAALPNPFSVFVQEHQAEKAMQALKLFLPHLVQVRREDGLARILAEEVVPGAVVILFIPRGYTG